MAPSVSPAIPTEPVLSLRQAREALFDLVDAMPTEAAALHQAILPLTRALRLADTGATPVAFVSSARTAIADSLAAVDALPSPRSLAASQQHQAARAHLLATSELLDHQAPGPARRQHLRLVPPITN